MQNSQTYSWSIATVPLWEGCGGTYRQLKVQNRGFHQDQQIDGRLSADRPLLASPDARPPTVTCAIAPTD